MTLIDDARLDKTFFEVTSLEASDDRVAYWRSRPITERLEALEILARWSTAMTRLPSDFKEFLRLLNAHAVEYLVVGGYAVAAHGYVRYTVDRDRETPALI